MPPLCQKVWLPQCAAAFAEICFSKKGFFLRRNEERWCLFFGGCRNCFCAEIWPGFWGRVLATPKLCLRFLHSKLKGRKWARNPAHILARFSGPVSLFSGCRVWSAPTRFALRMGCSSDLSPHPLLHESIDTKTASLLQCDDFSCRRRSSQRFSARACMGSGKDAWCYFGRNCLREKLCRPDHPSAAKAAGCFRAVAHTNFISRGRSAALLPSVFGAAGCARVHAVTKLGEPSGCPSGACVCGFAARCFCGVDSRPMDCKAGRRRLREGS